MTNVSINPTICHDLEKFNRDKEFEKLLNTMTFEYHWLIEGKLVASFEDEFFKEFKEIWAPTIYSHFFDPLSFRHMPSTKSK